MSRADTVVMRRQEQRACAFGQQLAVLVHIWPRNRPRPSHADVVFAVLPLATTVVIHKQVEVAVVEDQVRAFAAVRNDGHPRLCICLRRNPLPRLWVQLHQIDGAVIRPIAQPQRSIRRVNHPRVDRVQVFHAVRTRHHAAGGPLVRRVPRIQHRVGHHRHRRLERSPERNRVIQIELVAHAHNVRRPHAGAVILRHLHMHIVRNLVEHLALARPRLAIRRGVERNPAPGCVHVVLAVEADDGGGVVDEGHAGDGNADGGHLRAALSGDRRGCGCGRCLRSCRRGGRLRCRGCRRRLRSCRYGRRRPPRAALHRYQQHCQASHATHVHRPHTHSSPIPRRDQHTRKTFTPPFRFDTQF